MLLKIFRHYTLETVSRWIIMPFMLCATNAYKSHAENQIVAMNGE